MSSSRKEQSYQSSHRECTRAIVDVQNVVNVIEPEDEGRELHALQSEGMQSRQALLRLLGEMIGYFGCVAEAERQAQEESQKEEHADGEG